MNNTISKILDLYNGFMQSNKQRNKHWTDIALNSEKDGGPSAVDNYRMQKQAFQDELGAIHAFQDYLENHAASLGELSKDMIDDHAEEAKAQIEKALEPALKKWRI